MNLKVLSLSIKQISKNPVNLMLALFPTLISLSLYLMLVAIVVSNFSNISLFFQNYLPSGNWTGWFGHIVSFIFILFVFLMMSWTYIVFVSLISTPFNSVLSSRIEAGLTNQILENDKSKTMRDVFKNFILMLKSEFLKVLFIILLSMLALFFNLFPLFYPLSLIILSLLMAIQFLDFSWSRHNFSFSDCLKDLFQAFFKYGFSGFLFLLFMGIPFLNSLIPSLGTSYFTILWLQKQKKIQL
jgi:CysZ protein